MRARNWLGGVASENARLTVPAPNQRPGQVPRPTNQCESYPRGFSHSRFVDSSLRPRTELKRVRSSMSRQTRLTRALLSLFDLVSDSTCSLSRPSLRICLSNVSDVTLNFEENSTRNDRTDRRVGVEGRGRRGRGKVAMRRDARTTWKSMGPRCHFRHLSAFPLQCARRKRAASMPRGKSLLLPLKRAGIHALANPCRRSCHRDHRDHCDT